MADTTSRKVADFIRNAYSEMVEEVYSREKSAEYEHLLIFLKKSISPVILMPQEIYMPHGEKKRIITAFGGEVVIELKEVASDFDEACHDIIDKYLTAPASSKIKFFIITNYHYWRIYSMEKTEDGARLKIIYDGDRGHARDVLKAKILPRVSHKIPPHPDNIEMLFRVDADEIVNKIKNILILLRDNDRVRPLYEAYKQIMALLYGEASEDFYLDLFSKHTYLQAVVMASLSRALNINGKPEDMCSGAILDVDVASPYLRWWRILYIDENLAEYRSIFNSILNKIMIKVNLIDWEQGVTIDVFRSLYEALLDPETRRKIGEYYTPIWMTQLILREFNLRGKILLDPFCGSGTFLVEAFNKKIDEGESPDDAYNSLIGYDINPIAVTITRAELIMAYYMRTGRIPGKPPYVYHIDTLAAWFNGTSSNLPEVQEISGLAREYLDLVAFSNFTAGGIREILELLSHIEERIERAIRNSIAECGIDEKCLAKDIETNLASSPPDSSNQLIRLFNIHINIKSHDLSESLAKMIVKYGGDYAWGMVFASVYMQALSAMMKPDIIVTNPPWIHITEFKTKYAKKLRSVLIDYISKVVSSRKRRQVLSGSDVATAALAKSLSIASYGVAFIMNREQLFYHKNPMPSGILATYSVIRSLRKGYLKLVDVDFDAFQHGIFPSIIITRKGSGEELQVLKINSKYRGQYSKNMPLNDDMFVIEDLEESYSDYIRPSLLYFSNDARSISKALNALEVQPMGLYIRGTLGGEKKKGKTRYAGLTLEEYYYKDNKFIFKLHNTEGSLTVPLEWLRLYGIEVYKLVYVGEIDPFNVKTMPEVLLSSLGVEKLKNFLEKAVKVNENRLDFRDVGKIKHLIREAKQPRSIRTLDPRYFYVVYRADRIFTASVLKPEGKTILHSTCSAIKCDTEDKAYYYAAVLNYLVYKVIEMNRRFIHHQYARPLTAIIVSNLTWGNNSISEEDRRRIIALSKELSNSIPIRRYPNQKSAIIDMVGYSEFSEIINILDKVVDKDRLNEALRFVSER